MPAVVLFAFRLLEPAFCIVPSAFPDTRHPIGDLKLET